MVFLYQKLLSRFFPKSSSKVDIKTQVTKYSSLSVLQKPILLLPGLWNSLSQLKCRGSLETKESFFFFNWSLADLQCCINFRCTAKWFRCTHINVYFFRFFSEIHICMVCTHTHTYFLRFFYRLSQNIKYSSLCYIVGPCWFYFLYIVVCIVNPKFLIYPLPFSFGNHKFDFYVCGSVSVFFFF